MLQKTLTFFLFVFLQNLAFGQYEPIQPYADLGIKVKVLTLTEGKYQEFIPNDTLVRIGSVMFNTIIKQVVDFVNEDSLVQQKQVDLTSRFLSVDPIGRKYPELSPYQFASNTPIMAIDLDGLEAFFIHGTASDPNRWLNKNNTPNEGTKILFSLTNNKTMNTDFSWRGKYANWGNGVFNNEDDRTNAAEKLTQYVFENWTGSEDITLIGHSHGGNVAIQAAAMIQKTLEDSEIKGVNVNIITVSTPVDNRTGSKENPGRYGGRINQHTHIYNELDLIQTTGANTMDLLLSTSVPKSFEREYNNSKTQNYKVDVSSKYSNEYRYPKTTAPDGAAAHSFDVESDFIKKDVENGKIKKQN